MWMKMTHHFLILFMEKSSRFGFPKTIPSIESLAADKRRAKTELIIVPARSSFRGRCLIRLTRLEPTKVMSFLEGVFKKVTPKKKGL